MHSSCAPSIAEARFRAAPLEIRDEIARVGFGRAVLRLEPEPQVVGVRHGEVRRLPPPTGTGEPEGLTQRGRPEMRTREHEHERPARESRHGGARYIPVVQPAAAPAGPSNSDREIARRGPAGSVRPLFDALLANVERVIQGKSDQVRLALLCLLAEGHLLIEDVPGVGKTSLAKAIARSISGSWHRIQFTPDLLPSDVVGVSVWNRATAQFEFRPGGVFANVVLADEINRASPKTQSALLEAMEERQVTVDTHTYRLAPPFVVIATQNPIELEGTYPLPEAQLDRFLFNVVMTYLSEDDEVRVVTETTSTARPEPARVLDGEDILRIQEYVRQVLIADEVARYAVRLADNSRPGRGERLDFVQKWVKWGAGLRASHALVLGAKARALMHGRLHVAVKDALRPGLKQLSLGQEYPLMVGPGRPLGFLRNV